MIENILVCILNFPELLFPILIKSPYYSVTLFENIRLWTKSCSIDYKIQQTFFFLFVWPSPQTDTNKIICFFESISNEIWAFLSVFFFDPLNALKSIMFVEYFYAQHSPGAVQDSVQIPLVPWGHLALEWTFWIRTFRFYRYIVYLSIRHQ